MQPNKSDYTLILQVAQVVTQLIRRVVGWGLVWVKGITHLQELDKDSLGCSFSSTFRAHFDKYFDEFLCSKVSQKLEIKRSPFQTLNLLCIELSSGNCSFGFGSG